MSSSGKATVTFASGLGHDKALVAGGLLEADGKTITPKGKEVLITQGIGSPQAMQADRVLTSSILTQLAQRPAKAFELPGDHVEKWSKLRTLQDEGVIKKLSDGRYALKGATAPETSALITLPGAQRVLTRRSPAASDRVTLAFKDILRRGDRTDNDRWAILKGDVLKRLAGIPKRCVDMALLSPPYYLLRDYGPGQMGSEKTPELYVEGQIDVLAGVKETLAEHGLIFYVIQDKRLDRELLATTHDIVVYARRKLGLTLVDEAIWAKDSCLPNTSGTGFTMAHEYIFVFAKDRKSYYWNGVMARELGGRGVMRNAHSVQRFPHVKEGWQGDHNATFPLQLAQFALRCGLSHYGRCGCGEPWEDELTREVREEDQRKRHEPTRRRVIGASPRCGHEGDPEPLLVIDCFSGSGTSGRATLLHGNARYIGIENQDRFLETSVRNLGEISPEVLWTPQRKGRS